MTKVYDIVDNIKFHLEQDPNITKVSFGDFSEVDLDKTTLFPLAHFWITECGFVGTTMQFTLDMMFLDLVQNQGKEFVDSFYGSDNLHDVLNTQHRVVTSLVSYLGIARNNIDSQYNLVGEPTAEVLYEKFENKLAGWGLKVTFEVPNDYNNCG